MPEIRAFLDTTMLQIDKGQQQLFSYSTEGYHWHWNQNGTAEFLPQII